MLLKLKRSAFLAFGMAFLLDACSSDNPAGTSSGSSGAGTGNTIAGEASKALKKKGGGRSDRRGVPSGKSAYEG